MTVKLQITQEEPASLDHEMVAALWNATNPDALATSARAIGWALQARDDRAVAAMSALRGGRMVGCAAASSVRGQEIGWIDLWAVESGSGAEPIRDGLLAACELWLRAQGCRAVRVGGGPRSLVRGLPASARLSRFWADSAFVAAEVGEMEDMRYDVARYAPQGEIETYAGVVRPASGRDEDEVRALVRDAAQLRLASGCEAAAAALAPLLAEGGRIADLMLLWSAQGLMGVAQLLFRDSVTPIEVAYPYDLPQPWGALGVIAVRQELPDSALQMLLDASMRRLHNNGVNSCVALGVREQALYAQSGFETHLRWRAMIKRLD